MWSCSGTPSLSFLRVGVVFTSFSVRTYAIVALLLVGFWVSEGVPVILINHRSTVSSSREVNCVGTSILAFSIRRQVQTVHSWLLKVLLSPLGGILSFFGVGCGGILSSTSQSHLSCLRRKPFLYRKHRLNFRYRVQRRGLRANSRSDNIRHHL